jgi:hypothetical protein
MRPSSALASAAHRGGGIIDSSQLLCNYSSYNGFTNQYYCNASSQKKLIGCCKFSNSNNLNDNKLQVVGGNVVSQERLDKQIISLTELGEYTKAEELLNKMQTDAITYSRVDMLPKLESYTYLISSFIEEQQRHADESKEGGTTVESIMTVAEKVQQLLIHMEDFSGVSDRFSSMRLSGQSIATTTDIRLPSLQPTSQHYNAVISAFANAAVVAQNTQQQHYASHLTIKQAPFIASRWLTRMETLSSLTRSSDGTLISITPTVDSYYHVMRAYAASETAGDNNNNSNNKESKTPILVQSIFDKLEQNPNVHPTVRECRLLLQTWCNSSNKDAAYKAMGVWMNMQLLFRTGDEHMEPTLQDAKWVLDAWTRSNNNQSARRALSVLSTMEYAYTNKKTIVQPDLDCYRNVLITMSRSRVPETIHDTSIPRLFRTMEDNHIFPDKACFDAAIEALKNCARKSRTDPEKYAKATENMLRKMEKDVDRSSEAVVKPTSVTYTNVIQALIVWKNVEAAEKAYHLLKKMITAYDAGDESMRPSRDSYVGTIHAYGNSGSENKYIKANEILQRMITDYTNGNSAACPDVYSFHAVIRACTGMVNTNASYEKRKEGLMMAISILQQMKKSDLYRPNTRTYQLLLQCGAKLLPPGVERDKVVRSIFRSCCKDGLVDTKVLEEFQSAVSSDSYHKEVVRDESQSYDGIHSLPEAWTQGLGYRIVPTTQQQQQQQQHEGEIEHAAGGDDSKRTPTIAGNGGDVMKTKSTVYHDNRMRKRLSKTNQKYLQGGRI